MASLSDVLLQQGTFLTDIAFLICKYVCDPHDGIPDEVRKERVDSREGIYEYYLSLPSRAKWTLLYQEPGKLNYLDPVQWIPHQVQVTSLIKETKGWVIVEASEPIRVNWGSGPTTSCRYLGLNQRGQIFPLLDKEGTNERWSRSSMIQELQYAMLVLQYDPIPNHRPWAAKTNTSSST